MRRWLLVPALVAAAGVWAAFDEGSGIRTWLDLHRELDEAEARLAASRLEIEALRRDAAALEGDATAIERAVREGLELAKPGETIVRTPPRDGTNPRFP